MPPPSTPPALTARPNHRRWGGRSGAAAAVVALAAGLWMLVDGAGAFSSEPPTASGVRLVPRLAVEGGPGDHAEPSVIASNPTSPAAEQPASPADENLRRRFARLLGLEEPAPPPGLTCAGPPRIWSDTERAVGPLVEAAWRTQDPVQAAAAAAALHDCRLRADYAAVSTQSRPDVDQPWSADAQREWQLAEARALRRCQSASAWHHSTEGTLRRWAAEGGVLGATAEALVAQQLPSPAVWPAGTADRLRADLLAGHDWTASLLRVLARWRPDELAAVGLGPAAAMAQDLERWTFWQLAQAQDEALATGRSVEGEDILLARATSSMQLEAVYLSVKGMPPPEGVSATEPTDWRAHARAEAARARGEVAAWSPERRAAAAALAERELATFEAGFRCLLRHTR